MDRVIEERPNESQFLNFKQKIWLTRREKKIEINRILLREIK